MLFFALHLYFSAFMYPFVCMLHLENQREAYRFLLKLDLGQLTLLVFCRGAVRIGANGTPFSQQPSLHFLVSALCSSRFAAQA